MVRMGFIAEAVFSHRHRAGFNCGSEFIREDVGTSNIFSA
jgi:hypothetical protein